MDDLPYSRTSDQHIKNKIRFMKMERKFQENIDNKNLKSSQKNCVLKKMLIFIFILMELHSTYGVIPSNAVHASTISGKFFKFIVFLKF